MEILLRKTLEATHSAEPPLAWDPEWPHGRGCVTNLFMNPALQSKQEINLYAFEQLYILELVIELVLL